MVKAGDIVRATDAFTDWFDFTPTFSNFTLGNGSSGGRWRRVGSFTIELRAQLILGSTSSVTGTLGLTLPASLSGQGSAGTQLVAALGRDVSASTGYTGLAKLQSGGGTTLNEIYGPSSTVWNATSPFTWANGDQLSLHGYVEVTT